MQASCHFYQPLTGIRFSCEDSIFDDFELFSGNVSISDGGGGIDDGHVHSCLASVVEEYGVHRFAQVVVAAE